MPKKSENYKQQNYGRYEQEKTKKNNQEKMFLIFSFVGDMNLLDHLILQIGLHEQLFVFPMH